MADDYGNGVSRTLSALERQFGAVVWQKGKPPLDSELNLMSQIDWERLRQAVKTLVPSGFFMDPTRSMVDFKCKEEWSNYFVFGRPEDEAEQPCIVANVNGWLIPVAGTDTVTDSLENLIKLYPPPESGMRVDLVFLEAWQVLVAPNPSEENKPTANSIWRYGNTKYGGTNITDDLEDPNIGFETTERVQVQYRLRVHGHGVGMGAGVALDQYPDGLDDTNIYGQGCATAPVENAGGDFNFTNMAKELNDPSLWRAGNGDPNNNLNTIDGFTYAIPVCAVFRRNSNVYVAATDSGDGNQNGAFLRHPDAKDEANPLDGAVPLSTPTLSASLSADLGNAGGTVSVADLGGSGFDDLNQSLDSVFMIIDDEIIGISSVDAISGNIVIPAGGRGRYGSSISGHSEGATVKFFNSRPDGLFADEIHKRDILDLRRAINAGDWDYHRLLAHNLGALMEGKLRSTFKRSGAGDTEGVTVHEVDYLDAVGTRDVPNNTEALDGPDGIRTVWSDAATVQSDITVMLNNNPNLNASGEVENEFTENVGWGVAPDFETGGFLNGAQPAFSNGSIIRLWLGGNDGTQGARKTFRGAGEKAVRFVSPREHWKSGYPIVQKNNGQQHPVTIRFQGHRPFYPPAYGEVNDLGVSGAGPVEKGLVDGKALSFPGPMYPWRELNFEYPFIVLGGLLHDNLAVQNGINQTSLLPHWADDYYEIDLDSINFDAAGAWFTKDANGSFVNNAKSVLYPLLRGKRTLYDMLTNGGRDHTGNSSEVYLVLWGDTKDGCENNNGCFKVVGVGTSGYTLASAANSSSIVVKPLSTDFEGWVAEDANATLSWEIRSQIMHADDGEGVEGPSSACIVLTDMGGKLNHPWSVDNIVTNGDAATPISYPNIYDDGGNGVVGFDSKMVLSTSLIYHPGRSGFARIPDEVSRVGLVAPGNEYLRQPKTIIDDGFAAYSGVPDNAHEAQFTPNTHIQLWNRLPSQGWHFAQDGWVNSYTDKDAWTAWGGGIVGFTESDRENEALFDRGSKTIVFRPFRIQQMTVHAITTGADPDLFGGPTWHADSPTAGLPKDPLGLWSIQGDGLGPKMGYPVPQEYMPRFGRQDIPYHHRTGTNDPFMSGFNHLFADRMTNESNAFHIIGGQSNNGVNEAVKPMFFQTGEPDKVYCESHTMIGGGAAVPVSDTDCVIARKTTEVTTSTELGREVYHKFQEVHSSDLGKGLRGIQLPPYYGIARLYGVYDRQDFIDNGGATFLEDREEYTGEADKATNLLRTDNDAQSLYIMQDGALDHTREHGDHTYIIPENVIDVTRSPNHKINDSDSSKEDFDDFDYVVECCVFGFGKYWITHNNYVLSRRYQGVGGLVEEGVSHELGGDPEAQDFYMVLPSAASFNDRMYVAYNRTVYQGDPFMTRHGETRTVSDYEHRYGSFTSGYPSAGDASLLASPIQQYLEDGSLSIETPNLRSFEVLAALDFYTTMGTGSLGGKLFPGTFTDVGCIVNNPLAASRTPEGIEVKDSFPVRTRAFTEGQKSSTNRAKARVEFTPYLRVHPQDPNLPNRWDAEHPTTKISGSGDASIWYDTQVEIPWPVKWIDRTEFILTTLDGTKVSLYAREAGITSDAILDEDEMVEGLQTFDPLTEFPIGKEHFHIDLFSQTETLRGTGFDNVWVNEMGTFMTDLSDVGSADIGARNPYKLLSADWVKGSAGSHDLGDPDTSMVQYINLAPISAANPEGSENVVWPYHFQRGDVVNINAPNLEDGLVMDAWVNAPNIIAVRVKNTKNRDTEDHYDLQQNISHNFGDWDEPSGSFASLPTWPTNDYGLPKSVIATFSSTGFTDASGTFGTEYDFDGVEEGDTVVVNLTDDILEWWDGEVDISTAEDWIQVDGWVPEGGGAVVIRVTVSQPVDSLATIPDLGDMPPINLHVRVIRQRTVAMTPTIPSDQEVFIRVMGERYCARKTAYNFARCINKHPSLQRMVYAESVGTEVTLSSISVGAEGNDNHIAIDWVTKSIGPDMTDWATHIPPLDDYFDDWWHSQTIKFKPIRLIVPHDNLRVGEYVTATHFAGGRDLALNAGDGTTRLSLTGMTERLPLGILCQDSDFLGENPLGDNATAVKTSPAGIRPIQTILPFTDAGNEFDRFLGKPGDVFAMADGAVRQYGAYSDDNNSGSRRFRLYRGGGSCFVLSGNNPGGPLDWVSESYPTSITPVLKGGVLACKALLVRNFPEHAFSDNHKVSDGDEIQMVIITNGIFGDGNTQHNGITMAGEISPTGYGEGYAAADRYRLNGKPMFRSHSRYVKNPEDVDLAVYPAGVRGSGS